MKTHLDLSIFIFHLQIASAVHRQQATESALMLKLQLLLNFQDGQDRNKWLVQSVMPSVLVLLAHSHTLALGRAHKIFSQFSI